MSALIIACKSEERLAVDMVSKNVHVITDKAYTNAEAGIMVTKMLSAALSHDILKPAGYHYLAKYLNRIQATEKTRLLAAYYAERNLQEAHMLDLPVHKFTAAAVFAAIQQQDCQTDIVMQCDQLCQ
eukprot:gene42532-52747_t